MVGLAFWTTKPRQLLGACPPMYRPPEVIMYENSGGICGSTWNQGADVWAIASLVRTNQKHMEVQQKPLIHQFS